MADSAATQDKCKLISRRIEITPELHEQILAETPDHAILLLAADGIISSWMGGAEALFGYPAAEITGRSLHTLMAHAEEFEAWEQRAHVQGRYETETWLVRKTGTAFRARIVSLTICNPNAELLGFALIIQDVTDQRRERQRREHADERRRQAEAALRQSEDRFTSFMENVPGCAWIKSASGQYIYVNSYLTRVFGRPREFFLRRTDREIWPACAPELEANDQRAMKTGRPLQTIEITEFEGHRGQWLVSKFPIHEQDEMVVAGVAIDVSARARAEAELAAIREELFKQERIRSVGELASGLAHDLNNTLNALRLRLSLLSADLEKMLPRFALPMRLVDDAAARIAEVQDVARQSESGPLQAIDLKEIIGQAIEMVRSEVVEKSSLAGIAVSILADLPDLPQVQARPPELRHVFANLFLNARDAMPGGGCIRVSAQRRNGLVEVAVEDQGSGIVPELLGRIFEPFFTTKGQRGTGLGLAMAADVMKRLGGSIQAANRPDGGAVITLTFAVAGEVPAPAKRPAPQAQPGCRVIVIDDDTENALALKAMLELQGHAVMVFNSGPAALAALAANPACDVLLCDLGLHGSSGWEVAAQVKQLASRIRIYLLSGWAREIDPEEPRRNLVRGLLAKPIDPAYLDKIIRQE